MPHEWKPAAISIWWWALGYFLAYVPYSALTKALSSGLWQGDPPSGLELLAPSVLATTITALVFLAATGWWRLVPTRVWRGVRVPVPRWSTVISGLCASGIIATTTLAYTFDGISIVFVMLLMRGGMLIMAPVIDRFSGRVARWYSWVALGLSIVALLIVSREASATMTLICAIDVLAYLAFYALRLSLMSSRAKSPDELTNRQFFVEEQLVSSPMLLLGLIVAALLGVDELRAGFTTFWQRDTWWVGVLIGICSQGTGIAGGLVLLNQRENTFCIPVNRASSVLAGVVAALVLGVWTPAAMPGWDELIAASVIVVAIVVLSLGPRWSRRALT